MSKNKRKKGRHSWTKVIIWSYRSNSKKEIMSWKISLRSGFSNSKILSVSSSIVNKEATFKTNNKTMTFLNHISTAYLLTTFFWPNITNATLKIVTLNSWVCIFRRIKFKLQWLLRVLDSPRKKKVSVDVVDCLIVRTSNALLLLINTIVLSKMAWSWSKESWNCMRTTYAFSLLLTQKHYLDILIFVFPSGIFYR